MIFNNKIKYLGFICECSCIQGKMKVKKHRVTGAKKSSITPAGFKNCQNAFNM